MATGDRLPIAFSVDLAPEYSTTYSYSAGQCCTRNGILYVCVSNNVHGTWNPDAWQAVTVMEQVYSKDRYLSNVDELNKLLFLKCLKDSAKNTVAIVESSTTASAAHPTGSYFLIETMVGVYDQQYDPPGSTNGKAYLLYRAISDIAQGGTIVTDGAGQNCVAVTIGDDLSKAFSNTAPPFDPTETYAVGAYTIYNGILYRCTTAHQGTWTAGDFTAVSVGGDIANYLPTLFAPAGYGLGGIAQLLDSTDDLDNITQNGWYRWGANAPAHAPVRDGTNPLAYCTMLVMNGGASGNNILQIVHSFLYSGRYTIVMRYIGASDWEWTDPPLESETEYRTTERFNGSVVYTKLLSSVSVSSTGTVNCPHNVSNLARVIDVSGYFAMDPIACAKGVTISVDATNVVITTDNADVPASPNNKARVAIKYTKSS